jgi:hypothetical protein
VNSELWIGATATRIAVRSVARTARRSSGVVRGDAVLTATSQRSTSYDPTALLGRADAATDLKIAEPDHQFSPMRSFEAQSWTRPCRRRGPCQS